MNTPSPRPLTVAVLALLALTLGLGASLATGLFDPGRTTAHDAETGPTVRIIASALEGGSVEFGLRTSDGDQFPRKRVFPARVTNSDWLQSTPVEVDEDTTVRIIARRHGTTHLEFGLRFGDPVEERFPRGRFFPLSTTVGRWLVSTPLTLPAPEVEEPDQPAEPPEPPEQPEQPEPDDDSSDSTDDSETSEEDTPTAETISGGHRDGLIVNRGVLGDPDAPVLIVEYSDPF